MPRRCPQRGRTQTAAFIGQLLCHCRSVSSPRRQLALGEGGCRLGCSIRGRCPITEVPVIGCRFEQPLTVTVPQRLGVPYNSIRQRERQFLSQGAGSVRPGSVAPLGRHLNAGQLVCRLGALMRQRRGVLDDFDSLDQTSVGDE